MLTADTITQSEALTAVARARSPRVLLPVDPSEEELAGDLSLSEADKTEVRQCRGDDNRRRFALQLCVLRKYGRFLGSYRQVPVKVLTHLSRQLELSPVLFVPDIERGAMNPITRNAFAGTLDTGRLTTALRMNRLIGWRSARPRGFFP
jgi:hypothetical protein